MERDFNDLITFGFKRNDFWSFLWYFMKFFHQFIQKWREHTWGRPTHQKKAQTSYFHLSKLIKWSLKFHLSISQFEVTHKMTPKSSLVTTLMGDNHLMYLSDHLIGFIKWKYEVKPFQIRIERPQKYSSHVYTKNVYTNPLGPRLLKITYL